jgi:hypothetical protein
MSEWVLCTDVKPPPGLEVLLYVAKLDERKNIVDEFIAIGIYNGRKYSENFVDCNIIAWTLLPQKPWKELYEKWNADV